MKFKLTIITLTCLTLTQPACIGKTERTDSTSAHVTEAIPHYESLYKTGNNKINPQPKATVNKPSSAQNIAMELQNESDSEIGFRAHNKGHKGPIVKKMVTNLSGNYSGSATKELPVYNTESYDTIEENGIRFTADHPLSTFSIDVDTASYANMRRYINRYQLPPKDSVRIEELINYFTYSYVRPKNGGPFNIQTDVAQTPWNKSSKLLRIGVAAQKIKTKNRPASNLVFLLDTSGSMASQSKLPLLKKAFKKLVEQLDSKDRVSIVTYAGSSKVVLPSTVGDRTTEIISSLDRLNANGSTNGHSGLAMAYQEAQQNFIKGGVNRILLATDGDFNVGVTHRGGLLDTAKYFANKNIYISVFGFGMGNYKDGMMEELSNKANGNYYYIDSQKEANKVLVEQMGGTLITIAKDVKIQVEFNPQYVGSYRLIGYENRKLNKEDFNDDKKDAGEIGSGHTATAVYEIFEPNKDQLINVDPLKYQSPTKSKKVSDELLTVKIRYKHPEGKKSKLVSHTVNYKQSIAPSDEFNFVSSVIMFGMLLRDSPHKGNSSFQKVIKLASIQAVNRDSDYHREFIELVRKANKISKKQ